MPVQGEPVASGDVRRDAGCGAADRCCHRARHGARPDGRRAAPARRDRCERCRQSTRDRTVRAANDTLDELARVSSVLAALRAGAERYDTGPLPESLQAGQSTPPWAIVTATPADVGELLTLQRACWVQEAQANRTLAIPALHESYDDVRASLIDWDTYVVRDGHRLVGSARGRLVADEYEIGRLRVAPDRQGEGLGRLLLIQRCAPAAVPPVLMTGALSASNSGSSSAVWAIRNLIRAAMERSVRMVVRCSTFAPAGLCSSSMRPSCLVRASPRSCGRRCSGAATMRLLSSLMAFVRLTSTACWRRTGPPPRTDSASARALGGPTYARTQYERAPSMQLNITIPDIRSVHRRLAAPEDARQDPASR